MGWFEPRYGKKEVQKRKKPRRFRSWLSLEMAVAGAYWWRGTVRDAPRINFTGYLTSLLIQITLANFKPSIGVVGLPVSEGKKIPLVTFDPLLS